MNPAPQILSIAAFLECIPQMPVLDVRSPAEFAQAHIESALSFPLFSDEERAVVGTLYKQQGKEIALAKGLEFVGPKKEPMLQEAKTLAGPSRELAIYCWRGGMRSQSVAQFLQSEGLKITVLEKGYKAFRHHVLSLFSKPLKLIVLGGKTGSGKTPILKEIQKAGHQVLDLENLAQHKGSSFGALNEKAQPTSEQFENRLFFALQKLNSNDFIWIEDESRNIGQCNLPENLFRQMRISRVIQLEIPQAVRIPHLIEDYASADKELIKEALLRIQKRIGLEKTREALEALEANDFAKGARIALNYYDDAYQKGLANRNPEKVFLLELNQLEPKRNAAAVINFFEKHKADFSL